MTPSRTILFAGGGSGGHLTPGVAVADELRARDPDCRIVFVCSDRRIDGSVLGGTEYGRRVLPIESPGTLVRTPLRFSMGFGRSLRESLRLMDELQPEVVVGLGGFASVPVAAAAIRRRIPLVLLEQNIVPGRATSWLCRSASRVCLSFAETRQEFPPGVETFVTGNPVRRNLRSSAMYDVANGSILILGGSQGAHGVNAAASSAVVLLKEQLTGRAILHQTGERDAAAVREIYRRAGIDAEVAAYVPDLASRYGAAALVVSRAGATTLAELSCAGRPAILMPYPGAVRDHQRKNAEHFATSGGAILVPEGPAAAFRVMAALRELLDHPARLRDMADAIRRLARPDAASAVADILLPRSTGRLAA